MSIDAWLTVTIIGLCFVTLVFTRYAPDAVLMGGVTLLLLLGVLSPQDALIGLSNEGMVTVGALYVVAAGMKDTGVVRWVSTSLLGRPNSHSLAQIRLMAPVAFFSAFMNNTPVVAMMIPAVSGWARRNRLYASQLMIPLSYAAIIGGTCTLIGTSTNLIINGMLIQDGHSEGLGMFELAWVGIPCTILVVGFVLFFSRWLLPKHGSVNRQFDDVGGYTVEMMVEEGSPLVGQSIVEAGLRHLDNMYLLEIDRANRILPAVSPEEVLQANDRLIFVGVATSVADLNEIRGLTPATTQIFKLDAPRSQRALVEAVVSEQCPLIGKSIREGRLRTHYGAAVIAVARDGKRIQKKIGDIVLRAGDMLLMEAHHSFADEQRDSRDFVLLSRVRNSEVPRHEQRNVAILILLSMVGLVAFGVLSMLKGSLLAAGLMIMFRCTNTQKARKSVDWQVLILIAASIALGGAMDKSGAALVIADSLVSISAGNAMMALAVMFGVTAIMTAMISNTAAAVLMFPMAVATSQQLGVDLMPFAVTLMIAASTSFATPIGYQTNLMVYGPGGYHFKDFLRMGIPLTIMVGITTVLLVPYIWQL